VFPHTDLLCGVRMLDKTKEEKYGTYRIEVWVKFAEAKTQQAREIRDYLTGQFAELVYETATSGMLKQASDREKWVEFKSHDTSASKAQSSHYYKKGKGGMS
jgi:hypothetical protein